MSPKISRQVGAALVEILIVVVLASLLIGLFLHADLAVNRSILRWTQRSVLEQSSIGIGRQLRKDLGDADSINFDGNNAFEIFRSNSRAARYSFGDSTIMRNDRILLPESISLASFSMTPLDSGLEAVAFDLEKDRTKPFTITVTLSRNEHATQTICVPVRPYSRRQIE